MQRNNRSFLVLLIIELLGVYAFRLPLLYNFTNFAFWDWGGYLVAHALLRHGLQPISDFGWQYGLLPLLLQEIWFGYFGAGPVSFLSISLCCSLWFALAMGWLASCGGVWERLLIVLSLPLVMSLGADMPHALEPALLTTAILAQAKKQRASALALVTAALFTKPSMAYLYGTVLLLAILGRVPSEERLEGNAAGQGNISGNIQLIGRELLPAALTGCLIFACLMLRFGWKVVLESLWPTKGMRAYTILRLGWHGVGRDFFYFPGVKLGYYLGTPVTFWIAATLFLAIGATTVLYAWGVQVKRLAFCDAIVTCAILHFGFIFFFFGGPASWIYYAYILVIAAILTSLSLSLDRAILSLCLLAAAANVSWIKTSMAAWHNTVRMQESAGLFAPAEEVAEWTRVAAIGRGHRTVVFSWVGAAGLLCPWIEEPQVAFLVPGVANSTEIARELATLKMADLIVIATIKDVGDPLGGWPTGEFRAVMAQRRRVFKGVYFEIYAATCSDGTIWG